MDFPTWRPAYSEPTERDTPRALRMGMGCLVTKDTSRAAEGHWVHPLLRNLLDPALPGDITASRSYLLVLHVGDVLAFALLRIAGVKKSARPRHERMPSTD